MLSPADAELVRRDRAIPGLSTLLDPDAFLTTMAGALPGRELRGAQLGYLRYKPGTNCLAAYRIDTDGSTLEVYAKAHGPDASIKLRKAYQRPSVSSLVDWGRMVLDDATIVVSIFPNDSKLRALRRLGEDGSRSRLLGDVLPDRPDLRDAAIATLGYKPERRYVAGLQSSRGTRAVLRFYTPAGYQEADPKAAMFRSGEVLRVAHPLGTCRRRGVLALEWLPGSRLRDLLRDPSPRFELVRNVGVALAEFHAQRGTGLARRTRVAEAGTLSSLDAALGFLHPPLAVRVERVTQRLAAQLLCAPSADVPIHGDFYDSQVLVTGARVSILDLDQVVRGDPLADLGLFIAHLERARLAGQLSGRRAESVAVELLEGYEDATGKTLSGRLWVYAAAGLVQLAPHPFRYHECDWPTRIEAILERAEEILDRAGRSVFE
jgi:hypothetical protein